MILINGNIQNFNGKNYDWILIDGKKIIQMGYGKEYTKYSNEHEILDMKGRSVIPGFYDSHVHIDETVINETNIDFGEATSFEYIKDAINEAKKTANKKIILGLSLHYHTLREKRLPTRRELDKMCSDYPVWIASKDLHKSIINSRALEVIKLPLNINGIEIDSQGVITGLLEYEANAYAKNKIMSLYTFEEKCEMIKKYINTNVIPKGVTTLVAIESELINDKKDYERFLKFIKKLPIDIELYYNTTDVDEVINRKMKRIGGDIGVDGSFTSRNAALFQKYIDIDSEGDLYFSQEELNCLVLECYLKNLQVGLHAVGDRAFEQVLIAHEYAQEKCKNRNLRHRIEHAELVTQNQLKRAENLGVVISMQPAFETVLGSKGGTLYSNCNEMYKEALGNQHVRTNMIKEFIDSGLVVCGGSDSCLTPINPILGIYSAVNHPKKNHAVSLENAIKMFTLNAAYGVNKEKTSGSIEKGKKADLVVLDRDIESISRFEIIKVNIDITIKDGRIIYCRKRDENE